MSLALLLGWSPQVVGGLDDAELAAAVEKAQERAQRPPWEEVLAAIFEQLNSLYLLTVRVNSKRGARIPDPVRVPRPGDPASPVVLPPGVRSVEQPAEPVRHVEPGKRNVMSPIDAALAFRRGEVT